MQLTRKDDVTTITCIGKPHSQQDVFCIIYCFLTFRPVHPAGCGAVTICNIVMQRVVYMCTHNDAEMNIRRVLVGCGGNVQ
jgi:hypothetical protein